MLDAEATHNFWASLDTTYIQPEIEQRRQRGIIDSNFKIYQFRILMPKERPAIVELNEEVTWNTEALRGDKQQFIPDTDVYIHELDRIVSVEPPIVDDQRVAFVFFGWDGTKYRGYFDFEPNWPQEANVARALADDAAWPLNESLTHFLQSRLEERAARYCVAHIETLRKFGLWLVPILIPYPLAQIVHHLTTSDEPAARELLLSYCSDDYIEGLVANWWMVPEFAFRRALIEEALWAHQAGKYHLSIAALMPHIEGIVVHWEFNQGMVARFRTEARLRDFRDRTEGTAQSPFLYSSVQAGTIDFILTGPVLQTFQNWQDALDPVFPNRHAVGHGRYERALFTKESSIKIFLLLDTIKQLIAAQNQEVSTS